MKLNEYQKTRWGFSTATLVYVNTVVLIIYALLSYMVMFESGGFGPKTNFADAITNFVMGISFVIIPLIFSIKKFIIDIFILFIGLSTTFLGIIAFIPSFELGWTFFTIFHLALGVPLIILSVLKIVIKERS